MNEHDHHHIADASSTAVCPVCRMSVAPDRSPSTEFRGQTFYFCNEKCERAFLKNPDKFAQRALES